ncbi:MAG: hypothetical protein ABW170_10550 [Candidatus Thiodiazotropha sp. L084R]
MSNERNQERLIVLFLLGVLALNYPLLHLFGAGSLWLGIPVLYLYLFICWLLIIVFLAMLMETGRSGERDNPHRDRGGG